MKEIRLAKEGEIVQQKEIWQLCFGDPEQYLNLFFQERYKDADTIVLLVDGALAARLTIMPVELGTSAGKSYQGAMLYGVATHPAYQRQGLARDLLDYTNCYLQSKGFEFSLVVPAQEWLFKFYQRLGYQKTFYLREATLTWSMINNLSAEGNKEGELNTTSPAAYNSLRNLLLKDSLSISYRLEDIAYQEKLAKLSGAALYAMESGKEKACLSVERIAAEKIIVKELIGSGEILNKAIKQLVKLEAFADAREFIVRTPLHLGLAWGGAVRPFGLMHKLSQAVPEISAEKPGYLGLAFD